MKYLCKTVKKREDCRAWRVFRYFIEGMASDLTPAGTEPDLNDVFMCDPRQRGCEVFACTTCRHAEHQKPTYDLFDGVQADGSYESIGIGDKQPAVIERLNRDERLALAVLKLKDATFKAYSGHAGYMHAVGGALLEPGDFSGLNGIMAGGPQRMKKSDQNVRAALTELSTTNPLRDPYPKRAAKSS